MEEIIPNKCYNCGKVFRDDNDLARHKKRKTPCLIRDITEEDRVNPNRCIYCNKVFAKNFTLTKHLKSCKIKNGGLDKLYDKVKYEETIRIMKEEHERQMENITALITAAVTAAVSASCEQKFGELLAKQTPAANTNAINNTVNNNIVVNNNNNTVNIVINSYNKPNIDHLIKLDTFSKLFLDKVVGTPMELISKIWYDPEHPENTSIHLVNKKSGETLVMQNGAWITENIATIIPFMRERVYAITIDMVKYNPARLKPNGNFNDIEYYLETNRRDEKHAEYEAGVILQKMIDGRTISEKVIP